jgi:hypothetical protein
VARNGVKPLIVVVVAQRYCVLDVVACKGVIFCIGGRIVLPPGRFLIFLFFVAPVQGLVLVVQLRWHEEQEDGN